jgi:hypothetical protein
MFVGYASRRIGLGERLFQQSSFGAVARRQLTPQGPIRHNPATLRPFAPDLTFLGINPSRSDRASMINQTMRASPLRAAARIF